MPELTRIRGLPRGGHLIFASRHLGLWGVVVVLAVIVLYVVVSNGRR